LLYLLSAYLLSKIAIDKEANVNKDISIYILTNGVHTDIVLPTYTVEKDWSKEIKYANTILKDTTHQFIAMGWGDKGFYLETPNWEDLKVLVAFKAAFALGGTAIHATYYSEMEESETCKKIDISKEQYIRLVNYITNSFKTDVNDHFMHIKTNANYGKTDAFYEAKGSYSLLYNCNTWANSSLKT